IVGENAFAHMSGIHQDGFLKERTTYEIMTPQSIGLPQSRIVLGKLSGRHGFRTRLEEMGYVLTDEELTKAYERFIALCDRKKQVSDRDIRAIVEEGFTAVPEAFRLEYLHVSSGTNTVATATVRVAKGGVVHEEAAVGDGPVDAAYKAIDRVIGISTVLESYQLQAVTGGKDALGEVVVRIRDGENVYVGRGTSTDVIEASARAYLQALNKVAYDRQVTPQSASDGRQLRVNRGA
ncbi:MAG TPA: alpha-isopropylmalate synthase regulatory domain-containing protein, partial [Limnochordia bacterium]